MTERGTALSSIDSVVDRQWTAVGAPGTWMGGRERLTVAALVRAPLADIEADDPVLAAAAMVGHHAPTLRAHHVDQLEARGLRREQYVEIVGLVSRVVAIDAFDRGIGRTPRELPPPLPGEPSRSVVPNAKRRAGWVPAVGPIGPPTALTAVPAEAAAQEELHRVLYLSYTDMADLSAVKGLTRAQMELVAARTSSINDCFY